MLGWIESLSFLDEKGVEGIKPSSKISSRCIHGFIRRISAGFKGKVSG